MNAENDFGRSIRKGFLVWSWIGLLSAYLATSALLVGQFFRTWTEGVRGFDVPLMTLNMLVVWQGVPAVVLCLAWLTFYTYSKAVFTYSILAADEQKPEQTSHGELDSLFHGFRLSLFYLMATWFTVLFAAAFATVSRLFFF